MAGRRGWGEDSVYFDHSGECGDPDKHRHCPGRWRGVVSLGSGPDGKRIRRKVSGKNKSEVRAKLAELHDEVDEGVLTQADYTVQKAISDWLAEGLPGRSAKTISTYSEVLTPLAAIIGKVPLRELTAANVRSELTKLGATRSTRTLAITHASLTSVIRHAEANDKVRRNVAALIDTPTGQDGRPSRSLTFRQAAALIAASQAPRFMPTWRCRCWSGSAPRKPGRCGGSTSIWTVILVPSLPCRRISRSGGRCALTGTPRRRSRGGRSSCRS